MSAEKKPNEVKLVAWFMATKGVIKFANDDTSYKLGEIPTHYGGRKKPGWINTRPIT